MLGDLVKPALPAILVAVLTVSGRAGPSFQGLGGLPGGSSSSDAAAVSPDGTLVVGRSSSAAGYEAFRWTADEGIVSIGDLGGGIVDGRAEGVSGDGSVVVGNGDTDVGTEAFRWTAAGGFQGLGFFGTTCNKSLAYDVSADGTVVVGYAGIPLTPPTGCTNQAFRWTAGTGLVSLSDLYGGGVFSHAYGISNDGGVIVGESQSPQGIQAFRCTPAAGMVGLGDLEGGQFRSQSLAVSADGQVVVGAGHSAEGEEAFRWTAATDQMVGLGDLPGGSFYSRAKAVSGGGSVVVGTSDAEDGYRAFIWDAAHGMRDLREVLITEYSLDLSGWELRTANGISDDGLTIVGQGLNPSNHSEAWRAVLPEPGTLSLVFMGGLGLLRRRKTG